MCENIYLFNVQKKTPKFIRFWRGDLSIFNCIFCILFSLFVIIAIVIRIYCKNFKCLFITGQKIQPKIFIYILYEDPL